MSLYSITLTLPVHLPESQVEILGGMLEFIAPSCTARREDNDDSRPWLLSWFCEDQPKRETILPLLETGADIIGANDLDFSSLQITEIENEDWLTKSYQAFQPFSVGPFFIHGSHHDGAIPGEQMPLQIDAATAFGSGEHGTTKGCLLAMLDLKYQGVCPWNILDMGTGSGILAIAAWKLWHTPILAVDIDEKATDLTRHHAQINGVSESSAALSIETGDGFAAPLTQKKSPYELVIANILAGPLKDMAADLVATLDKPGYVILSGMLVRQADEVLAAYEAQGLALKKRYDLGEWTTLLLHNAGL